LEISNYARRRFALQGCLESGNRGRKSQVRLVRRSLHSQRGSACGMTVLRTLPVLLCLTVYALGQGTHTLMCPTSAERHGMLAHLRANLDEYAQHMPDLVCLPPWKLDDSDPSALRSRDFGSIVIVDLKLPSRIKQNENTGGFSVDPLIRDLSTSDAKFLFAGWTTLRRKQVALFRTKGKFKRGFRQAEIYLDRESSTVSQIVFQGLSTPQGTPIFCRVARE
jgi:hypothetical protein